MASGILSLVLPNVLDIRGEPHTSLSEHDITVALASAIQQELSEVPTRIDLYVKGLVSTDVLYDNYSYHLTFSELLRTGSLPA
jgi:hypothetical protein